MIGCGDGHAHFDPRAFARMGLDRKQPMHEPHSLAHADEAERAVGAAPNRRGGVRMDLNLAIAA
jgi:hypothetical protein